MRRERLQPLLPFRRRCASYKAELAEVDDYDAHLLKIKNRLNKLRSPFRSAEFFEIEEIIDPRDTRASLCRWAKLARRASTTTPPQFWYRP